MLFFAIIIYLILFANPQSGTIQKRKAAASLGSAMNIGSFVISTSFKIASLIEDNKKNDRILEKMDAIEEKIDILVEQGQLKTSLLSTLVLEIKKSTYHYAIIDPEREINYCFYILNKLVESPHSQEFHEIMKACYSRMSHVQQIAKILSGHTLAMNSLNFFDIIIEHQRFCNGTELVGFQSYLKRILIRGCAAVVSAEVLKYGNSSYHYQGDCTKYFEETDVFAHNLFYRCADNPCNLILKNMNSSLQEASSVNDSFAILSRLFPWFHFLIIEMARYNDECFQENVRSFGNQSFNLHTFWTKDKMFLVSYLDQQYTPNGYGNPFGFELHQSCKIAIRNDLGAKIFDIEGPRYIVIYMYNENSFTSNARICNNGTAYPSSTGCSIMVVTLKDVVLMFSFTIGIVILIK